MGGGATVAGVLDGGEADAVTAALRLAFVALEEDWTDVCNLAAHAYAGRVWIAQDFPSWADYVRAVLNDGAARLPREVRGQMAGKLAALGMSTRAIAPVVGVSNVQVLRDVTPDGGPATVTGIDGKEYPAGGTKAPRASIVKSSRELARALWRDGQWLERLMADDRFARNRDEIVSPLKVQIEYLSEVLAGFEGKGFDV